MNNNIKLLLAEDERMLAEILSDTLSEKNFEVHLAFDGAEALEKARRESFDVVVTDIMMPKMDGFTLARQLRSEGFCFPILFLTARSATEDVVKGFEIGGNDFLKKPFAIDELIVRIKALVGRISTDSDRRTYSIGKYIFDPYTKTLVLDGKQTILAARESEVLLRLCRNMGHTIESAGLLRELWGDDNYFNLRSFNVYISRLRRLLQHDPTVEIVSIRGVGYQLRV